MDFSNYLIGITATIIFLILIRRFFSDKGAYFTSKHEDDFVFNSEGDINDLIFNALRKSKFIKISSEDNSFVCYAKPSLCSWSEVIIVKHEKISESSYQIFFSSTCFFPLQIFDWGKNKDNCNLFCKNLL